MIAAASGAGCFLTVSRLSNDPDITVYGLRPSQLRAREESGCPGLALSCLGTRSTEPGAGRGLPGSYPLALVSRPSPARFQDTVSPARVVGWGARRLPILPGSFRGTLRVCVKGVGDRLLI